MTKEADEMLALIKRLRLKEYFSDELMAARSETDADLIDRYRKERKDAADAIELLAARPPAVDREAVAKIIGSFPNHKDDRGDDNTVLHDAFSGDYDERTEQVYALADAILALLRPAAGEAVVPKDMGDMFAVKLSGFPAPTSDQAGRDPATIEALIAIRQASGLDDALLEEASAKITARMAEIHQHADAALDALHHS